MITNGLVLGEVYRIRYTDSPDHNDHTGLGTYTGSTDECEGGEVIYGFALEGSKLTSYFEAKDIYPVDELADTISALDNLAGLTVKDVGYDVEAFDGGDVLQVFLRFTNGTQVRLEGVHHEGATSLDVEINR